LPPIVIQIRDQSCGQLDDPPFPPHCDRVGITFSFEGTVALLFEPRV